MPRAWEVARRRGLRAANDDAPAQDDLPAYAELHCLSDFSFLRGAASAEALFERALRCGYEALAITDECSLAGIVRGLEASRATGLKLVVGSEFTLACGMKLVLLVEHAAGYAQLCRLITHARRAAPKGEYALTRHDVETVLADGDIGLFALWCPAAQPDAEEGRWLRTVFGARAHLAVELHREQDDDARMRALLALAAELRLVPLAAGDVHMALRRQRVLQDTMTAIRHGLTLADCGAHLFRNGERHLRTRRALANIHRVDGGHQLLDNTVQLARRCTFDLGKDLEYRYPAELVPPGHTPASWLRVRARQGMRERWPEGVPAKIVAQIDDELALIADLQYEAFFLTVDDIVRFAKSRDILCQGRGSAANSAVCFALGITVVNPAESRLLMARFLSKERNEPPDIDVDFEHERREEVLQYV
ncbi:MAG: PHP domain-containing protein, partial [Lysobacteraceae bacterium]